MTDAQARNLGRLIQAARLRQGLSFRDLQKLTGGLPLSSLKALEDGRWSDPAPANVMRVAEALQIDPARIDRVSRDHLADALPGVRTYFRSKTKASPEQLDEIEAAVAEIQAKYQADAPDAKTGATS